MRLKTLDLNSTTKTWIIVIEFSSLSWQYSSAYIRPVILLYAIGSTLRNVICDALLYYSDIENVFTWLFSMPEELLFDIITINPPIQKRRKHILNYY